MKPMITLSSLLLTGCASTHLVQTLHDQAIDQEVKARHVMRYRYRERLALTDLLGCAKENKDPDVRAYALDVIQEAYGYPEDPAACQHVPMQSIRVKGDNLSTNVKLLDKAAKESWDLSCSLPSKTVKVVECVQENRAYKRIFFFLLVTLVSGLAGWNLLPLAWGWIRRLFTGGK